MSHCFCAPSCQRLQCRIPPPLPYPTSSQPVAHKTEPARLPKRTPNPTCAHNYCTISQNNDTDSNEATQLNTPKLFGKRNKLDPPYQHRGGGGAHSVRLRRLRRRDVQNMLLTAKVSINKRLHQYPNIHSQRYITVRYIQLTPQLSPICPITPRTEINKHRINLGFSTFSAS